MSKGSNGAMKRETTDPGGRGHKRVSARAKRRMMVKFGVQNADRTAFTRDISETGLFIKTNSILKPGSTVQVSIEFPDKTFSLWARVVWAKKVPAQLSHILDCGMGVCFIDPPLDWIEYCRAWKTKLGIAEERR